MAEGDQPPPKRAKLSPDDIERLSKDELIQRCLDQEVLIESLGNHEANEASSAEFEEKFRQLQQDTARRENVLVMRLTAKEQELQELMSQNEEMKRAQNPSTAQLRGMLLDPAINLMFQRMKKEMEQSKEKLEQAQNDLAAWKFTPDGQTGKRLMAKCRMLLQENSELGRVISAGRTAKLEGEIALGKKFVEEMKQSQAETDEFLVEMDEDVEGLQSTIYLLQQQLKEAKEQLQELQEQLGENGRTNISSQADNNKASSHTENLCTEVRTTGGSDHDSNNGGGGGREIYSSRQQTTSNGGSNNHHPASAAADGEDEADMDSCTDSTDPQELDAAEEQHNSSSRHSRHSQQQDMDTEDFTDCKQGLVSGGESRTTATASSKVKLANTANETIIQNGMLELQGNSM